MSDHAISNARSWLSEIVAGMAALEALDKGEAESVTFDGDAFDDADTLRVRLEESPLSIRVRDGWRSPGQQHDATAEEFEILLSTGGPALRICGELDCDQPDEFPSLQWQDWGTPWTSLPLEDAERESLSAFARLFYFGEG